MKMMHEIFAEIKTADGNQTEIQKIIAKNKCKALAIFFMATYGNPEPLFTLDELPAFKYDDSPVGMNFSTLRKEVQKIDYFFKPAKAKRDTLIRRYINICEALHPLEADLFTMCITKRLCIAGLDYETINNGFGEDFIPKPKEINKNVDRNTTDV